MEGQLVDRADGQEEYEEDGEDTRAQQRDPHSSAALKQIKALLRRNFIERRRTKSTTFCELFSPVLLLCVLVYGYSLSDVLLFPEKVYTSLRLELPGDFGELLPFARLHSKDLANASSLAENGNLTVHGYGAGGSGIGGGGGDADLNGESDGGGGGSEDGGTGGPSGNDDGVSFHDVKRVFKDMTGLMDGPFPVPTFDQFVGLGSAITNDLGDGAYSQVINSMESGWVFGNILTQGTLHLAPAKNPAVGELVSWLSNTTSEFDGLTHRVHESEDDAVVYALDHLDERTWAVIALDDAADGRVDYTIRMNFTVVPNTNTVVDTIAIGLDPSFRSYYLSGFLTLQTTLDRFMFSRALPAGSSEERFEERSEAAADEFACVPPDVVGVPFPTAQYDQNLFYAAAGYLLGLAMTMCTMYPLSRLVKGIVEEKESRVRETMRIMGLRVWCHELSWLITGVVVFTFIAVTVAALLSWTFLPLADGSLVLVYMLSFTLSEVSMALLVASFFSKAKLASIAAPCVLFAGVLPRYIFYGSNRHDAPRSKRVASLLSPAAFTFGADFIADYEYAGIGAGWGNYDDGDYSLRTSIGMMFFDAVLYCLLAWYLDKVVTPEFGTSQDPLKALTFVPRSIFRWAMGGWRRRLSPPYRARGWTPVGQNDPGQGEGTDEMAGVRLEEALPPAGMSLVEGGEADFEPLEEEGEEGEGCAGRAGGRRGVLIKGLRKEFGTKVAVAGLDLRLRVGDITCLLGHNGAGKSTTISMLTGQVGATSGDAIVWGHSVRDELHKVRQDIGICPQHDALMPLLTAREHIEMFMDLKGMRQELKGPLVTKKLREVGLLEKEHTPSMSLSGGQKRKLSVALALTGSPTLCILDEPTSGMDPYSRRFTWDLLRRRRAGRCTLLSTHFMEEADHLGDRVAMLRRGRLRCAGSPLFLKSRFGIGYKLTVVKAGEAFEASSLSSLVISRVPNAEMLSAAGGEVSFRLPREESENFPGLFRDLEAGRRAMGVGGYGISITSLEEVFLSLEREGKLVDARQTQTVAADGEQDARGSDRGHAGTIAVTAGFPSGEECGSGSSSTSSSTSGGVDRDLYRDRNLRQRRGSGQDLRTPNGSVRWEETTEGQLREIEMQNMATAPSLGTTSTASGQHYHPAAQGEESAAGRARPASKGAVGRNGGGGDSSKSNGDGGGIRHGYAGMDQDEEDLASLLAEPQEDEEPFLAGQGQGEAMRGRSPDAVEGMNRLGRYPPGSETGRANGTAWTRLWDQLCWLLWKRRVVAFRDWKGGLYQVVLPAILVALVLILLTVDVKLAGPSLAMSAEMFGSSTQVLYVEGHEGGGKGGERKVSKANGYASVAEHIEAWTRLDQGAGLSSPTSYGLSRYMLDTYDTGGLLAAGGADTGEGGRADDDVEVAVDASSNENYRAIDPGLLRDHPHRYGAFVFGDRILVNVTVDWDSFREHPEMVSWALEMVGDGVLPSAGGEVDLKELMSTMGIDEKDFAKLILEGSDAIDGIDPRDENVAKAFLPDGANGGDLDDAVRWAQGQNWTSEWLDLVAENPTARFARAEYLPQSEQLKLEGVVLLIHVNNETQDFDLGDVTVGVDDVLKIVPSGTVRYDKGLLGPNGTITSVMFNSTAPHALPAWLGELTAKTFESCATRRGADKGQPSYTVRSHPLPLTATESLEVQTMLSLLVSLLVTIPLCYAPAAFVTFLVRERACKSKRVQLVSGASPLAYWLSTYLWDALLFFVLTVLVMLTFAAYGRDASKVFIMHWDALLGTWGLLVSYGLSALPLSYLYSFAFDGPSAAQISIAGINFLSGFGFLVAYVVLSSLEKTAKLAERAQHVFRLFPPYLLGDGLLRVSSEFYMGEVLGRGSRWGVLNWDVSGRGMCYMLMEAVGYLCLVLAVEYSLAAGVRGKADRLRLRLGGWSDRDLAAMLAQSRGPSEDEDVKNERTRVEQAMARPIGGANGNGNGNGNGGTRRQEPGDTVLISGLTKVYPPPSSSTDRRPKRAVRGLSLGVRRGECFGLLGINGAGKSTTLQILTRDLQATSGRLTVEGKAITSSEVSRLIGYCPQTDPLLPLMTVNETLLLFGGLKGVGVEQRQRPARAAGGGRVGLLQKAATAAMSAVNLGPTENQLAGTLSGGNKRKLSLAVALIGGPAVLLLDEPSSGMDPGARRSMWEVISSLSESRSVILTTHSMEECEAVCDRLGIMVGGRLRCIGTSQHLKEVFGGGYSIEVRCPTASMPRVTEMIRSLSPLARLDEMHPTLAKFSIPAGEDPSGRHTGTKNLRDRRVSDRAASIGGLSLSEAFETIEARKAELQVWDYSISQATLETIFMSFAKNQEEEVASVPGVSYTNDVGQGTVDGSRSGGGLVEHEHSRPSPFMDVEMRQLRTGLTHQRRRGNSPDADFVDQEDGTTFV